MIALLAAMQIEAKPVAAALTGRYLAANTPGESFQPEALVAFVGIGERASAATANILSGYPRMFGAPFDAVISFGFCGGLADDLGVGDVVIARETGLPVSDLALASDSRLLQQSLEAAREGRLRVREAASLTVDRAVTEVGEKRRLREETGADIVEMEGYWVGEAARREGVPFLAVRAVLDTASERFRYIPGAMRPDGTIRSWAPAAYVALRPWSLGWLRSLARARDVAAASLAGFFEAFMQGRGPIAEAGPIDLGPWKVCAPADQIKFLPILRTLTLPLAFFQYMRDRRWR